LVRNKKSLISSSNAVLKIIMAEMSPDNFLDKTEFSMKKGQC